MAKKGITTDSLQQASTREPSTRSGDQTSLEFASLTDGSRSRGLVASGIGGGSFKSYKEDHIKRLHDDIEQTTRKLELEQRRLYTLDKALAAAEKEHTTKWQKYQIVQSKRDEKAQRTEHEVKKRERRLEKAYAKLNLGNADNEHLRTKIDRLRRERLTLDKVFRQLEKDIQSGRKELERRTLDVDDTQKQGEDAKQKAKTMHSQLERERRVFKIECERLKAEMQEEVNIQNEMDNPSGTIRGQDKNSDPRKKNYMVADEEESFSEQAMHRRILKISFLNTILRRHIRIHQKNIEVFEQAFSTIKSSTGISDIEEIVKIFMVIEQRNFSLMTYVNQLNREIEAIEIRNRDLRSQLRDYEDGNMRTEERRKNEVGEVAEQIRKVRGATEEKDLEISATVQGLADSRPIIFKTAKFLEQEMPALLQAGFDGAPPPPLRAPDEHEEDLNRFLMYVEDMILQFRICLPDAKWSKYNMPAVKPLQKDKRGEVRPSDLPSANPPADDVDDEDAGLEEGPWTRSELRARAQANVQRRMKKFGGQHAKSAVGTDFSPPRARLGDDAERSDQRESPGRQPGSDGTFVEVRVGEPERHVIAGVEDDVDDHRAVMRKESTKKRS